MGVGKQVVGRWVWGYAAKNHIPQHSGDDICPQIKVFQNNSAETGKNVLQKVSHLTKQDSSYRLIIEKEK